MDRAPMGLGTCHRHERSRGEKGGEGGGKEGMAGKRSMETSKGRKGAQYLKAALTG